MPRRRRDGLYGAWRERGEAERSDVAASSLRGLPVGAYRGTTAALWFLPIHELVPSPPRVQRCFRHQLLASSP